MHDLDVIGLKNKSQILKYSEIYYRDRFLNQSLINKKYANSCFKKFNTIQSFVTHSQQNRIVPTT